MPARHAPLLLTPLALALALWIIPAAREETQLKAHLAALDEERGDMDADAVAIRSRLSAKYAVAADLIADRITLAHAAERFHDLNRDVPVYMTVIRWRYPGRTDEESQARNVVDFSLARVGDPAEVARVRNRLAAAFRAIYPDAPPIAEPEIDPPSRPTRGRRFLRTRR